MRLFGWAVVVVVSAGRPAASAPASAPPAQGPLSFPVVVRVDGQGAPTRVVVSAVVSATPCDAPSARLLFDGQVAMGTEVALVSPTPCVCHRYANGYFRTKDLGAHQVACFPRFAGDTLPMRIAINVK